MITPQIPTEFFTAAPLVLAGLVFIALRVLMAPSRANLCIAGFVGFAIPSPMMLVVHPHLAFAMIGLGVACAVPAYLLAEEHHDDDGRGRRGTDPVDPDPGPGSGPDSDLWNEFEREFWSHVERTRELVHA
jgi:hypothetical protein